MANSIASKFSNLNENEIVYAQFIKEKIEKAGGQLKLQHITGHLSQLNYEVRSTIGASSSALIKFLRKHKEIFVVDGDARVSLQKSSATPLEKEYKSSSNKNHNDLNMDESEDKFPPQISNVRGVVIKILPTFGFISIKKPIETSVYFTPSCFNDGKKALLTDYEYSLHGQNVYLDAKRANTNFEAKYRATKVEYVFDVDERKTPKAGSYGPKAGSYDSVTLECNGDDNPKHHNSRMSNESNMDPKHQNSRIDNETKMTPKHQNSTKDNESNMGPKHQNSRLDSESKIDEPKSKFPLYISKAHGIVIKVLPTYGFISIKDPVKTSVYFTPYSIKDANKTLFTDLPDILPGKKVCLDARKSNKNPESKESKYYAMRVWTPKDVKNEVLVPDGFKRRVPKEGFYDPDNLEGSGIVNNVFPNYGFITSDDSEKLVFFHKNCVCNVQNIMDLSKIFSVDDHVEFKAIRSAKKDNKVKWEASKVWIKKAGKSNLFKSSNSSGIGSSDGEAMRSDSKSQSTRRQRNGNDKKNSSSEKRKNDSGSRELLNDEPGKLYPHNNGSVIKFGKNDSELADADSCLFYMHNVKVEDVCWEFSDGDNVVFDGIKIKSAPGWKALLGWVGTKPNIVLPTAIGDFSEFSDEELDDILENDNSTTNQEGRGSPLLDISRQSGSTFQPRTQKYASSASSQISNSSSKSFPKSKHKISEVDRKSELASEDNLSSASFDSRSQASGHNKRKYNKSKYYSRNEKIVSSHPKKSFKRNHSNGRLSNYELDSEDSCTVLSSRASSKESINSESFDFDTFLRPNPDIYKNWGDSPYPDEEEEELNTVINEKSSVKSDCDRETVDFDRNASPKSEKSESASSHTKLHTSELNLEVHLSANESRAPVQEIDEISVEVDLISVSDKKVQKPTAELKHDSNDILLHELTNSDVSATANEEPKPKAYIKKFHDLEGRILKVFCRYAEVENSELKKVTSVLWNDLYHNGVPVADKFDDMKEVIKAGQTIKFNCIEIVDDDGCCWQKVTIAWKGQKPKVKEMTPTQYISQNYLHVTIDEKYVDDCEEKDPSQSMRLLNSNPEPAVPPRKFLTVAFSNVEDDEIQPSVSADVIEDVVDENAKSDLVKQTFSLEKIEVESAMSMEMTKLTEAVSRMLSSCIDSQVDVSKISMDIINLVLKNTGSPTVPASSFSRHSHSEKAIQTDAAESQTHQEDSHFQVRQTREMTSSDTQTIITGEVIAQSVTPTVEECLKAGVLICPDNMEGCADYEMPFTILNMFRLS